MEKKYTTCRDDNTPLIVKHTKRTQEQLAKSYYYTAYYYCPRCSKMYFSDEFKIDNLKQTLFSYNSLPGAMPEVEIWTDGACKYNGMPNASAAWGFVSGEYEACGKVEGKQTNNTAEALAIYHALLWAVGKGYKRIKIYSDSQISLHNMHKPLERIKMNQELFARMFSLIEENQLDVTYEKVLGHSGDPNNERADKLANTLAGIK